MNSMGMIKNMDMYMRMTSSPSIRSSLSSFSTKTDMLITKPSHSFARAIEEMASKSLEDAMSKNSYTMSKKSYVMSKNSKDSDLNSSPIHSELQNRVSLPKELFEAVDFTNMGVVEESKDCIPTFVKGEKYALKGVSCEGFEMPEKVYELVAVHDKYGSTNVNSLIVKQISGDQSKIFTLSKNDCAHIGIKYESGLQLFPKSMKWRRVKDIVPFNPSNLATTPLSDIDNTIRYVLLKLNGFKDYADGYVVTPSGKLIKEKTFEKTLTIVSNEPIVYANPISGHHNVVRENIPLKVKVVYPKNIQYNHGNFISSEDTVYLLVDLTIKTDDSIDYSRGVTKVFLEGFNPNDHFTISWDELGAYTVEEYEAEKARKEKERLARIEKEEAERKKRIAEEEERIKEQRRRTEEAIERMKSYKIEIPQFPKMENFDMNNGISSLTLYMDGLNVYLDGLDTSLEKTSRELTKMTKEIGNNLDKAFTKTIFDMLEL